jgi:hypothetical protein
MEDTNVRIAVIFREHAERVAAHLDDGGHTPLYNIKV